MIIPAYLDKTRIKARVFTRKTISNIPAYYNEKVRWGQYTSVLRRLEKSIIDF
jgi:hypothetical protein